MGVGLEPADNIVLKRQNHANGFSHAEKIQFPNAEQDIWKIFGGFSLPCQLFSSSAHLLRAEAVEKCHGATSACHRTGLFVAVIFLLAQGPPAMPRIEKPPWEAPLMLIPSSSPARL